MAQAAAATAAIPGSKLKLVVIPAEPDRATVVLAIAGGQDHAVSVDPNGTKVIAEIVKDNTLFYWANKLKPPALRIAQGVRHAPGETL